MVGWYGGQALWVRIVTVAIFLAFLMVLGGCSRPTPETLNQVNDSVPDEASTWKGIDCRDMATEFRAMQISGVDSAVMHVSNVLNLKSDPSTYYSVSDAEKILRKCGISPVDGNLNSEERAGRTPGWREGRNEMRKEDHPHHYSCTFCSADQGEYCIINGTTKRRRHYIHTPRRLCAPRECVFCDAGAIDPCKQPRGGTQGNSMHKDRYPVPYEDCY